MGAEPATRAVAQENGAGTMSYLALRAAFNARNVPTTFIRALTSICDQEAKKTRAFYSLAQPVATTFGGNDSSEFRQYHIGKITMGKPGSASEPEAARLVLVLVLVATLMSGPRLGMPFEKSFLSNIESNHGQ